MRPDRDDPLAPAIRRTLEASRTDCPDAETIAAYAERALGSAERRGVEQHLSNCARCRETLLLMSRAAQADTPASSSPRFLLYRWPWLAGVAAAGAAIVIWLAQPPSATRSPESDWFAQVAERDLGKEKASTEPARPEAGAPVPSEPADAKKAPSASRRAEVPAAPTPEQPRDRQAVAEGKQRAVEGRDERKLEEAEQRRARADKPAAASEAARPAAPAPGAAVVPIPGEGARRTTESLADNRMKVNVSIQGPELESFLRTASVLSVRPVARGVTDMRRLTMELDGVRRDAAWWVVTDSRTSLGPAVSRGAQQRVSGYCPECAAYELDKLLGLGMVPVTIERVISGERGWVTLWVENTITEQERRERTLQPPDPEQWSQQVFKARLFDSLIDNTDRNLGTSLITDDWQLRLIEHSWSFSNRTLLNAPDGLVRFSRSLLKAMARLNEPLLKERLGRYITVSQIQALLKRRDLLIELAKRVALERGEAVYFP